MVLCGILCAESFRVEDQDAGTRGRRFVLNHVHAVPAGIAIFIIVIVNILIRITGGMITRQPLLALCGMSAMTAASRLADLCFLSCRH